MNKIFFETFEYLNEDMKNMALKKQVVKLMNLIKTAKSPQERNILKAQLKAAKSNLWNALSRGQKTGTILNKFGKKFVYAIGIIAAIKLWNDWATKDYLRFCSGLDKLNKKKCILNQKIKANEFVINQIHKNISQCNNMSDPQKCVQTSEIEIKKYQSRNQILQKEISLIK